MSDSQIGYAEPGTPTHKFDVESLGGAPPVVRERVQLAGSGVDLAEIVRVLNTQPAGAEYGLVVRPTAAPFKTRSDTYTGAATGTAVDASRSPLKHFSLQVVGTGAAATAWDVRLEGSLDGTVWVEILRHTNQDGDGAVIPLGSAFPVLHLRTRCAAIVLGGASDVVATLLGVP